MAYFGFGMGALLIAIGGITYWLAPRVGPNPWFGVRTGYSVASREVWDKSNRVGGLVFAACGLMLCLAAALMPLVGVDEKTSTGILTGGLIGGALAATGVGFLYSRSLAMDTDAARELQPVPFRWAYVAPVLASAVVLVAVALYFYPHAAGASGWPPTLTRRATPTAG